jgi:hypothetical protein
MEVMMERTCGWGEVYGKALSLVWGIELNEEEIQQ